MTERKHHDPKPVTNRAGLPIEFHVKEVNGIVQLEIMDPRIRGIVYGATKEDLLHQLNELVKQVKAL